jgi:hypothetical protein
LSEPIALLELAVHPIDIAYRTYLRAELAKLRNRGDAEDFIAKARCGCESLGLPRSVAELTAELGDQARVDAFVDGLDLAGKRTMAECCEDWRGNSLAWKLAAARSAAVLSAPIDRLQIARAEQEYEYLFERNGWRLLEIAADPELRTLTPYSGYVPGAPVAEARCIAELNPGPNAAYRIIDGIHRAIHLVWSGAATIDLCVLVE